jgi:hypothetical protein
MIHLSTYLRNLMAISYFSPDHGFPFFLLQNMNTIQLYVYVCFPSEVSEYEQVSCIGISSCIAQRHKREVEVGTDGATSRPMFITFWQYFHSAIGPCMFICICCVIFVSGMSEGNLRTAYPLLPQSTLFDHLCIVFHLKLLEQRESACCVYSTRNAENFCKWLQCLSLLKTKTKLRGL